MNIRFKIIILSIPLIFISSILLMRGSRIPFAELLFFDLLIIGILSLPVMLWKQGHQQEVHIGGGELTITEENQEKSIRYRDIESFGAEDNSHAYIKTDEEMVRITLANSPYFVRQIRKAVASSERSRIEKTLGKEEYIIKRIVLNKL